MVKMAEGTPVIVSAGIEQDFKITPAQLEAAITPKTKLLILCSPSNPTGSVYSKEELAGLAAVFANNFPNYLYQVAGKLLEDKGLSFAMLRPLIFETAHKVMLLNPEEAQTGPAKRGDESIMNMHKNMLKNDKDLLKIYTILSEGIKGTQDKEETGDQKISQDIIDMPTLW